MKSALEGIYADENAIKGIRSAKNKYRKKEK